MNSPVDRRVAVDLGRTHCRLVDAARTAQVVCPSGVTVADPDGPARVCKVVMSGLQQLHQQLDAPGRLADPTSQGHDSIDGLVVAAAGVLGAPEATHDLFRRLTDALAPRALVVTGDIVAAHAGALGQKPGVVLIAGTGAVALGIAADGTWHRADGHGALLDDAGSGYAIGRAGIRAALRHHDARPGGSPALAAAAYQIAPAERLAATLQSSPDAIADIAAFAPLVATAARNGDSVAQAIFDDAAHDLAATTIAAIVGIDQQAPHVALRGPLTRQQDLIGTPLRGLVSQRFPDVLWTDAGADALDGALSLLGQPEGIHLPLSYSTLPYTTRP